MSPQVDGGITFAIASALKAHRIGKDAIRVLWTKEGSIILCLELDLPHALALLDLYARGDERLTRELRVRSIVPAERDPEFGAVRQPSVAQLDAFRPDVRAIVFTKSHFEALGLPEPPAALDPADVQRKYRRLIKKVWRSPM